MNMQKLKAAAVVILALGAGLGTSTAFAQVGYAAPSATARDYARSDVDGDQQANAYDRMGHFSCGYDEVHTRLERKNCGGTHYSY